MSDGESTGHPWLIQFVQQSSTAIMVNAGAPTARTQMMADIAIYRQPVARLRDRGS